MRNYRTLTVFIALLLNAGFVFGQTNWGTNTVNSTGIASSLGTGNTATGTYSFTWGAEAKALEHYATAFGFSATASGRYSTAFGSNTTASGQYATAFGMYTTAQAFSSLAIGRYNVIAGSSAAWIDTDPLFVIGNGSSSSNRSNVLTVLKNGKVGIGTAAPAYGLDVVDTLSVAAFRMETGAINGNILTCDAEGNAKWSSPRKDEDWSITGTYMYSNRDITKVELGTTSSLECDLEVDGKIIAKEIEVRLPEWPDFVFAGDYSLKPISEIEAYIKANKHLPGVPSEREVKENGVNLGEMDAILLQKIEEMTLYLIELRKENDELRRRVSSLEQK